MTYVSEYYDEPVDERPSFLDWLQIEQGRSDLVDLLEDVLMTRTEADWDQAVEVMASEITEDHIRGLAVGWFTS